MENNIENFAKILSEYSLTKLEYSDSETHILLERAPTAVMQVQYAADMGLAATSVASANSAGVYSGGVVSGAYGGGVVSGAYGDGTAIANSTANSEPTAHAGTPVKAAFVGTVYRRRKPEEPPICEVGIKVEKGDTLCVIEAMKMFTDIVSPVSGTVSEICFEDGALAEYGQVLCYIK